MGWVTTIIAAGAACALFYTERCEHLYGLAFNHRTHPKLSRPWCWSIYRRDGRRLRTGSARWWITAQISARWARAGLEALAHRQCLHSSARRARVHGGR